MKHSNIATIAALAIMIMAAGLAPMESGSAHQQARLEERSSPSVQPANGTFKVYLPLVTMYGARITNVANGDSVAQTITLLGDYYLGTFEDIWLFVVPFNQRYYPQSMNACTGERTPKMGGMRDGRFEMRATLGVAESAGQTFQILLTTADAAASQPIVDTLIAWCRAGVYPGFEQLPQGVRLMGTINVTRTADRWGPAPPVSDTTLPGQVAITNLTNNAAVPQSTVIMGTYTSDVTADIWVLVYATNGRWYPQSNDACNHIHTQKANGQWQVRANFGGALNVGEPFDIVVVLADPLASATLDRIQEEWCKKNNYPGWLTIELPKGLEEKTRIRVFRQ